MVDDTFAFQIQNLTEPMFDITGGSLMTLDMNPLMDLVENGIVACNTYPVVIVINVTNTGELMGMKNIVLKDGLGAILETIPLEILGGGAQEAWFTNTGAGYNVAEGTTEGFTVEAG